MVFDPLTWAMGLVGRGVVTKILESFSADELTKGLQAELTAWAHGLATEGISITPQALTDRLFSNVPDESPRRTELREVLVRKNLPDAQLWFAALYERWEQVRHDVREDAQEFFRLDPADAEKHLRRLSQGFERACQRNQQMFQHAVLQRLDNLTELVRAHRVAEAGVADAREAFVTYSKPLLNWPTTLHRTGDHINRAQLQEIIGRIREKAWSTTIVLGPRGTGKSALLAAVGAAAGDEGWTVFAIKADLMTECSEAEIERKLNLKKSLHTVLTASASEVKTVVIIDQLDATAEILDRTTEKLNFILNLVQRLSSIRNVHVVLSSREFEFRTDSRLRTIGADEVLLDPLPWDDVVPVLNTTGHTPQRYSDELRDLLCNPWALNIYLDVAKPDEQFGSLTDLLDRLWLEQITCAVDAADRERLLSRITDVMTEEEQLSVPTAIGDQWPQAMRGLIRDDILVREGTSIGFRHQTFYEFIVARRFTRGEADFLDHVRARQDGLFVRPTVFATLLYMRDSAPRRYADVVRELLENPDIRLHVRSLALDFVGGQREPRDVEVDCLLPILIDEKVGPRLLRAASGSPGWFDLLRTKPEFRQWMRADRAYLTLSMLATAVHFARNHVLDLVEEEWLPSAKFDWLTAQILQELTTLDPRTRRIATTVSGRSDIGWLVEHVAGLDAVAGIEVIASDFRRQASSLDGVELLEKDQRHEMLDELAKQEPARFLESVWPIFVATLDVTADPMQRDRSYRHVWRLEMQREYMPGAAAIEALRVAARTLAERDPDRFENFVAANEHADVLLAHVVLSEALEIVARTNPTFVLEYLLRDDRRLAIGLESQRTSSSASLISAIYPQLDAAERRRLEAAVKSFTIYTVSPDDDMEKRKAVANWNRQHRLHLLAAFTGDAVPAELQRLIAEERRRFPNLDDYQPRIRGGMVGARMRAEEMQRASDDDLLNLFNEITDASGERWIGSRLDVSRAGGSGELARELEELVKKDPPRGLRLLPRFTSDKHSKYAAAVVTALAETRSATELETVVVDLEQRGFTSDEFRTEVCSALGKRANLDAGLSEPAIDMLIRWLYATPSATSEPVIAGEGRDSSVVFTRQLFFSGGGSRARIISTIGDGLLLRRPPAIARWLEIVGAEVPAEMKGDFWQQVIAHMVAPLNESESQANQLLDEIFGAHADLLERQVVLWFLALFMCRLEPTLARRWLEQLRSGASDVQQQAYGELLVVYDAWHGNAWSRGELQRIRESGDRKTLAGVAWGSEYVWGIARWRPLMADVLIRHVALATDPNSAILSRFVAERLEDDSLDDETQRVIRAIVANDALLVKLASDLLALIELHAVRYPDLAAHVTKRVVDVAGADLSDVTKVGGYVAADLTSITLTLHRQTKYRAIGLQLFERMIELDVREAQAALEVLDRKPTRRFSPPRTRRRWRHLRRRNTER
jgi:DNA replication protein DnaC